MVTKEDVETFRTEVDQLLLPAISGNGLSISDAENLLRFDAEVKKLDRRQSDYMASALRMMNTRLGLAPFHTLVAGSANLGLYNADLENPELAIAAVSAYMGAAGFETFKRLVKRFAGSHRNKILERASKELQEKESLFVNRFYEFVGSDVEGDQIFLNDGHIYVGTKEEKEFLKNNGAPVQQLSIAIAPTRARFHVSLGMDDILPSGELVVIEGLNDVPLFYRVYADNQLELSNTFSPSGRAARDVHDLASILDKPVTVYKPVKKKHEKS